MKISTTLIAAAAILCFSGCTKTQDKTPETATAASVDKDIPVPVGIKATTLDENNVEATMELSEPATAAAPPVTTAPGMNPPHGQPGHDCAIAVGAPLNSKNSNASAPQLNAAPQTTSPVGAPTLAVPPVTSTAPGLNPPHGQPGHDCAVAVGAPLRK